MKNHLIHRKILLFSLLCGLLFMTFGCGSTRSAVRSNMGTDRSASYEKEMSDNNGLTQDQGQPRLMVYDARMSIGVKKLDHQVQTIENMAKGMGGYVSQTSKYYVVVRIPADKLDAAMKETAQLGKVYESNKSSQDITSYYYDLKLRKESAEKTRQRYLELLNQAKEVSDILLIEKELQRINMELERYKATLKKKDNDIQYSILSVHLRQRKKPGPLGYVFKYLWKGIKFLFVRD